MEDRVVKLDVPVAPVAPGLRGFQSRHVTVHLSSAAQREALAATTAGLIAQDARLAGGKVVTGPSDAVSWILEQVAEQVSAIANMTDEEKE